MWMGLIQSTKDLNGIKILTFPEEEGFWIWLSKLNRLKGAHDSLSNRI